MHYSNIMTCLLDSHCWHPGPWVPTLGRKCNTIALHLHWNNCLFKTFLLLVSQLHSKGCQIFLTIGKQKQKNKSAIRHAKICLNIFLKSCLTIGISFQLINLWDNLQLVTICSYRDVGTFAKCHWECLILFAIQTMSHIKYTF